MNIIEIDNTENFNLADIFDCGQCFRFNQINQVTHDESEKSGEFEGVAFGKYLRAVQKDDKIHFETTVDDYNNIWRSFFDIDRDYKKIYETLRQDDILKKASDFCPGIRILRQDPFECLISFIFSQNNNIPRIKKIIERLCENFGEAITLTNNRICYSFPSAERIAGLTLEDLDVVKSGFRAKYILDAAKKINAGEINLASVYDMTLQEGAEYLKRIRGVGDKIAACVLLFAYNKLDAFPVDVWIKKVLAKYYPQYSIDKADKTDNDFRKLFGEYAGIANSYLFYYERENNKK